MFPYTEKYTESESDIQNKKYIIQNRPTIPKYIRSAGQTRTNRNKPKNPLSGIKYYPSILIPTPASATPLGGHKWSGLLLDSYLANPDGLILGWHESIWYLEAFGQCPKAFRGSNGGK